VVRTCDAVATSITDTAKSQYIGKVPNDEPGQQGLINAIKQYLALLAKQRVITTNFNVALNPDEDSSGDEVFLIVNIVPVDVVEYIFMTINVN